MILLPTLQRWNSSLNKWSLDGFAVAVGDSYPGVSPHGDAPDLRPGPKSSVGAPEPSDVSPV